MNQHLMDSLQPAVTESTPIVEVGDTVRVHQRITEGRSERVQVFEGTVISRRGGIDAGATYTVRRIAAHGVAVERTYPLHSTNVLKVEVRRKSKVRRAQLYYLRSRQGKSARLKERIISRK